MMSIVIRVALAATVCALSSLGSARAGFTVGDFYATDSFTNSVAHYDAAGAYVGSLAIPSSSSYWNTQGVAYGPDGLLYVVQSRFLDGLAVLAFDSTGAVQKTFTYNGDGAFIGNLSLGKLAFDGSGRLLVGANLGVIAFNSAGVGSFAFDTHSRDGNGAFDVQALANGHILVASSYEIYEVDGSGNVLRTMSKALNAPTATGDLRFGDVRGIQYDASHGVLYVSMLGYTGEYFQILKIDYLTGRLLGQTTLNYADDMLLTPDGRLLVGSGTNAPTFFDLNLNKLGSLSSAVGSRMFVTQITLTGAAVPEPTSLALLALGLGATLATARVRRGR